MHSDLVHKKRKTKEQVYYSHGTTGVLKFRKSRKSWEKLENYFSEKNLAVKKRVINEKISRYPKSTITDIRLCEDQEFANQFALHYLPLKEDDSLMRLKVALTDETFSLDTVLIKKIVDSILIQISNLRISNFVVSYPCGKRQHYDHRMTKAIAEKITVNYNANLYYLDDIPYSVATSKEAITVLYEKILSDENLKYKYKIMNIYESQMCDHYYQMVKTLNRERLFVIK